MTATKERALKLSRQLIDCGCNSEHAGKLLGEWGLSWQPYRYDGREEVWRWRGDDRPKVGDWIERCQSDIDDYVTLPVVCPFDGPDVRVERLQDISAEAAIADGVPIRGCAFPRGGHIAIDAYAELWDQIHGPGSWDANPWVWVVSFERTA